MIDKSAAVYKDGVMLALGAFQFLEETLKAYTEVYFDTVRKLTAGKIYFGFERKDYQESALGRLVHVFSKTCGDKELVGELREMVPKRDHIAHQALLRLFHPKPTTAAEYAELIKETTETLDQLQRIGRKVAAQLQRVSEVVVNGA